MTGAPQVRFDAFCPGDFARSFRFAGYAGTISADRPAAVLPALRELELALAKGLWAAGFLAYEAAAGFEPLPPPGQGAGLPLLWFALYRQRLATEHASLPPPAPAGAFTLAGWRNGMGKAAYLAGVERIRDYIAAGDTYQVNYTFPRTFRFAGDPAHLYAELCRSQQAPFCADIAFDRWRILSASPELFFARSGDQLTVRPMKGTARRGRWTEEDRAAAAALQGSRKEQAENLMIVDLMRNDLGKLAIPGSVKVPALFAVETLPTLHQLTSTVTARLRRGTGLTEIMQALFPCGSVTGAPKRRSMEIIHELEGRRRGLYTGCIGFAGPNGEAVFSVAIRTAVIDLQRSRGQLGIGSGITWDAQPAAEYAECRAKAAFMTRRFPEFRLVATMLHEEGRGFALLDRHLQRLAGSAAYFAYRFDAVAVGRELAALSATTAGRVKVRLLLARDGSFSLESAPLPAGSDSVPVRLRLSRTRVDEQDPFLFHKTTHRPLYQREAAAHPGEEVIFRNRRGEITEGVTTNLVARLDGRLVTPPLACGLLPGVLRAELLAAGTICEQLLTLADLRRAEELLVINSVRGWRPAVLAGRLRIFHQTPECS